jgi:hypothetical protein
MIPPPNNPAYPALLKLSRQMQRKAVWQIVNVANRQARTRPRYIDERASLKNSGQPLNPNGLIDRSTRKPTSIEKAHVHRLNHRSQKLYKTFIYPKKIIVNCHVQFFTFRAL